MFINKHTGNVINLNSLISPFIKWHTVCQLPHLIQYLAFGFNGGRFASYIEFRYRLLGNYTFRHRIRSVYSGRRPYHEYGFTVYFFRRHLCKVRWRYFRIIPNHLFHYAVYFIFGQAFHRTLGYSVFLFHSHKNISTADILQISGKGANGVVNLIRIPPCLKFYSIGLNFSLVEQIFYVDW